FRFSITYEITCAACFHQLRIKIKILLHNLKSFFFVVTRFYYF
ncbi:unnamed protein product, partial [Rotaria socialis]